MSVKTNKKDNDLAGKWYMKCLPWIMFATLSVLVFSIEVVYWPGEVIISFLPQILILLSGVGMTYAAFVIWLVVKHGPRGYIARIGRLVFVAFLASFILGGYVLYRSTHLVSPTAFVDEFVAGSSSIKIGTFNKLFTANDFVADSDLLFIEQVDVISLQEVTPGDVQALADRLDFEYSFVTDCGCSAADTEVAIVSRYPIRHALTVYEHENSVILRSLIDSDEHGEFIMYTVHMHVPVDSGVVEDRKATYAKLAESVDAEVLPVFVAGDFNTTIYSPQLSDFSNDISHKAKNVVARRWPKCSWYGFGEAACARIDYVFVPISSIAKKLVIDDDSFSDHRSVIVEVSF